MTDTIAGLRAARALIERGWTQGNGAVDSEGLKVHPRDDAAVAWCLEGCTGAIDGGWRIDMALSTQLEREGFAGHWLFRWNDDPERTKEQVLDLVDRTIARLEAEAHP